MMGIVSALRSVVRSRYDTELVSAKGDRWETFFGGTGKVAGVDMDEWKALNLSTVMLAVRSIAEDTAILPVHLFRRLDDDTRERVKKKHPARKLLLSKPNREMTAFSFRETLTAHCLTWGNGYAEIERDGAGRPIALWPLRPDRMTVRRNPVSKRIEYEYSSTSGGIDTLAAENVFHVKGLGYDGLVGYNVIRFARESLGGAKAAEEHGRRHFAQGAIPPFAIMHPQRMSATARDNLRIEWDKSYGGVENAGKTAVLDENVRIEKLGIPLEESQYLQTRQFNVPEIARWFRMPPHKLMDLLRATFSNIEHQEMAYAKDTLAPWQKRWEEEAAFKLLTPEEQDELYFETIWDARLQTDTATRSTSYRTGIEAGYMSVNEVRRRENLSPLPDGQGDMYRWPGNTITAEAAKDGRFQGMRGGSGGSGGGDAPKPPPADPNDPPPGDRARAGRRAARATRFAPMCEQIAAQVLRVEADKARRSHKKGELPSWAEAWYESNHKDLAARLKPVCIAAGVSPERADPIAYVLASSYSQRSRDAIAAIADDAGAERTFGEWESRRAKSEGTLLAEMMVGLISSGDDNG